MFAGPRPVRLFLASFLVLSLEVALVRAMPAAVRLTLVAGDALWPAAAAAQAKPAPVTRAQAAQLYAANCQICHGPGGTGTPLTKGMAFVGRGNWKHGSRSRDVVSTITNGVPATPMLPFKERLAPAEIHALAALVRSFDKTLRPAGAGGKR